MTKKEQLLFKNKCLKQIIKCLELSASCKKLRDIYEYVLIARLTLKYLHEMTDYAYPMLAYWLDKILKSIKQN